MNKSRNSLTSFFENRKLDISPVWQSWNVWREPITMRLDSWIWYPTIHNYLRHPKPHPADELTPLFGRYLLTGFFLFLFFFYCSDINCPWNAPLIEPKITFRQRPVHKECKPWELTVVGEAVGAEHVLGAHTAICVLAPSGALLCHTANMEADTCGFRGHQTGDCKTAVMREDASACQQHVCRRSNCYRPKLSGKSECRPCKWLV
jgi:hypothetical protein